MALNPEILGRPLFPSAQRTGELLGGFGKSLINAFTPAAGTPPATMAGVSIPPAGASLSQLQFNGPLLGTGPMFGIRGTQQAAPQPAQPSFDYGTYAATRGLPSFDVTKTQTPFTAQNKINTAALTGQAGSLNFSIPSPFSAPKAMPTQATPAAGFARVSDWSQNPLVQAARATGDVSAIARATEQARNQGRSAFAPKDITGVSLAALKDSNPEAGFGTGRTPAQQQALLAQMRTSGQKIASDYTQTMKNFAESRGPRFAPMAAPQGRYGQPLTENFPQSREAIAQRVERNAPVLSATGFGAMQRSIGQAPELRGPLAQAPSLFANRGGFESRFGGPQPASPMVASSTLTDEQRRRIFQRV